MTLIDAVLLIAAVVVLLRAEPAMNRMMRGRTPLLLFLAVWFQAVSAAALMVAIFAGWDQKYALVGLLAGVVSQLATDRRAHDNIARQIGGNKPMETRG